MNDAMSGPMTGATGAPVARSWGGRVVVLSVCTAGLALVACGGGQHGGSGAVDCAQVGTTVVRDQADADRLAGCAVVRGDLVVAGAGEIDLTPLGALVRIEGNLHVGPTLALNSIDGFGALQVVGGHLELVENFSATGAYFGALERVGGSVRVRANPGFDNVALGRLAAVGASVWVVDNPSLARLDIGAVVQVGRDLVVTDNPLLESMPVAESVLVGGTRIIARLRGASKPTSIPSDSSH